TGRHAGLRQRTGSAAAGHRDRAWRRERAHRRHDVGGAAVSVEVDTGAVGLHDAGLAWRDVCLLTDLSPERGAAALLDGVQVALFRTHDDQVYAVQQLDPYSAANVMSRGIVGSRGDVPTVASPMYKQVFD